MKRVCGASRFQGKAVDEANMCYRANLTHAKDLRSWQRAERWVKEFTDFARVVCGQSGIEYEARAVMGSNELMRLFLSTVVGQGKGFSVPKTARRFLNAERLRLGFSSLNQDVAISNLLRGATNSAPRTRKHAAPLHEDEVCQLLSDFDGSWLQRQVATMAGVGLLTVMRGVELRTIRTAGVRFVLRSGKHVGALAAKLPGIQDIKAVLFHVPWRKQHQAKDVWVPLACPRMVGRVLQQLREGRRQGGVEFLFPSVSRGAGKVMNAANPLGREQFQREMQRGLVEVCGFDRAVAELFTGHCLRLGGSNYMRRLGLDAEIHRKLGGWMSIKSSQGYMVLTPREQAKVCEKMALTSKRSCAFKAEDVPAILKGMSALIL
jgi:hypothetical protein